MYEKPRDYILEKASISSYIVGGWSFAFFLILMPPTFMSISEALFRPVVETLWGISYNTYPGMILSDVVGYIVVSLIAVPVSLNFAYNMYHAGKHLGLGSLRFLGKIAFGLAAASIVVVPFVYQNALDAIAVYRLAMEQGILYSVAFFPLGLPVIQAWISVSLLIVSLTLAIAAGRLCYNVYLTHFIAATVLTSTTFIIELPVGLTMLWTPVNMIPYGGNNGLVILTIAAAIILFGVGLGQLARRERTREDSHILQGASNTSVTATQESEALCSKASNYIPLHIIMLARVISWF